MGITRDRIFEFKDHWLSQRSESPYWYIFWRSRSGRRVHRRSTRTSNLEAAKSLLVDFAGGGSARAEGCEWYRLEDALQLYIQHMRGRPSAAMVEYTAGLLKKFATDQRIEYVSQFTADQQDRYIARRRLVFREEHQRQISNATLNRELGILRTAFQFAWKCGRISHELYVGSLPEPPPRERVLTLEECRRLMAISRDQPHLHLFIKLALFTLQRKSAILGLQVNQVDLLHNRIDFRTPGVPPSSKRRAVVPIPQNLWPDLAKAVQASQSGHVIERNGRPVASVKRSLATASRRVGLSPVTPQVLRRTSASLLAGAGVPMRQVSGMLGHSQLSTTERYAKHAPEYLGDAAAALEAMWC